MYVCTCYLCSSKYVYNGCKMKKSPIFLRENDEVAKVTICRLAAAGNDTRILVHTTQLGMGSSVEKKFNQFYCLIMILGYKRNSKLLFMKKNLEPSWRYHLTHTANSAQIWQNFMAGYTSHPIWLKISFHFSQF